MTPRSLTRFACLLLAVLCLAGCAAPQQKIHPAEIPKLPQSQGFYGGKIYSSMLPWFYEGSTAKYHHFYYTYHRDNLLYGLRLLILKSELSLPFEQKLGTIPGGGFEVVPIRIDAPSVYSFARPVKHNPGDEDWLKFPSEPAPFTGTLDKPR